MCVPVAWFGAEGTGLRLQTWKSATSGFSRPGASDDRMWSGFRNSPNVAIL